MDRTEKQKTWLGTVFEFAAQCKGKMTLAVIIEILSVIGGFIPYIAVYMIISGFFSGDMDLDIIIRWTCVCVGGYIANVVFHGIATTLSHRSAYSILENIRLSMTEKLMKAPLGVVIDQPVGRLKNNIVDRVETIELPLAHLIPEGISNLLLPVIVYVYLITIDWRMALAALISIPAAAVVYGIVMASYNKKYEKFMESSNHVNSVIVEYIEGIEVIKAFGRSGSSYEKYVESVRSFKDFTMDWFKSTWIHMSLGGAILPSTLLGTVPIGLLLYSNGSLSPSDLIMCFILALGIVGPLTTFTVFVNDVKAIQFAVNDAKKILDIEELEERSKYKAADGASDPEPLSWDIDIRNVTFSYGDGNDSDELNAVESIDLSIPKGSFTALVGPSGSGKSTIAKLITRFWDVDKGSIMIGGRDIREMPLSNLNNLISYVAQDNFLFDCDIMENIRLGNPEASDEQVIAASKAARCHGFIEKLDEGYRTSAGVAGTRLSGGEKQRIAIARMMLKDAPVVILDEATAFTDPENESEIQKSISKLTENKTLLVIAHRLSTVKNADSIAVVDKGSIKDTGTHEELLKKSDLYRSMWDAHKSAKSWAANIDENRMEEVV